MERRQSSSAETSASEIPQPMEPSELSSGELVKRYQGLLEQLHRLGQPIPTEVAADLSAKQLKLVGIQRVLKERGFAFNRQGGFSLEHSQTGLVKKYLTSEEESGKDQAE